MQVRTDFVRLQVLLCEGIYLQCAWAEKVVSAACSVFSSFRTLLRHYVSVRRRIVPGNGVRATESDF